MNVVGDKLFKTQIMCCINIKTLLAVLMHNAADVLV